MICCENNQHIHHRYGNFRPFPNSCSTHEATTTRWIIETTKITIGNWFPKVTHIWFRNHFYMRKLVNGISDTIKNWNNNRIILFITANTLRSKSKHNPYCTCINFVSPFNRIFTGWVINLYIFFDCRFLRLTWTFDFFTIFSDSAQIKGYIRFKILWWAI